MDPMKRVLNQFGGVAQVQLALDVFAIRFHCTHAQVQFGGDLTRAAPFANQPEDFELAVGQILNRISIRGHPS